jgi:hypothetical protein
VQWVEFEAKDAISLYLNLIDAYYVEELEKDREMMKNLEKQRDEL